jgi:hypothetical protein
MSSLPKCHFNYETLKAKIGNKELQCVQIPPFTKQKLEREDAGNGWYGAKVLVTKTYDKYFAIIENGKIRGILIEPYHQVHSILSDIYPLDYNYPHKEIKDFIKSYNK